jgi:hypothetical protein
MITKRETIILVTSTFFIFNFLSQTVGKMIHNNCCTRIKSSPVAITTAAPEATSNPSLKQSIKITKKVSKRSRRPCGLDKLSFVIRIVTSWRLPIYVAHGDRRSLLGFDCGQGRRPILANGVAHFTRNPHKAFLSF